jgi:hypothetical protein
MWPKWAPVVEIARNALFIAGVILLVAGEVIVRYRAVEDVYSFSRQTKKKKEEHEV